MIQDDPEIGLKGLQLLSLSLFLILSFDKLYSQSIRQQAADQNKISTSNQVWR